MSRPARELRWFGVGLLALLTTGSGWPVYDAANHLENMRSATALTQLLQRHDGQLLPDLRSILQVEHDQYEALRTLLQRVGEPPGGGGGPDLAVGPGLDNPALWSWGGLTNREGGTGTVFDGRGALTIYGQLGAGAWKDLVLGAWRRWAEAARDIWLEELGAAAGWTEAEAAFAQWLSRLSPGEMRARRGEIARGLARLAVERWLEQGDDRRDRLQVLAEVAARQGREAQRPATVVEALVHQTEAVAQNTTTLVEGLRLQAEGAEASLLLQRTLVEEAAEAARQRQRERVLEWANIDAP